MKNLVWKSIFISAMSLAMLGGCGKNTYVSGTATSAKASNGALILEQGTPVRPEVDTDDTTFGSAGFIDPYFQAGNSVGVYSAELVGYYDGCAGHLCFGTCLGAEGHEGWVMKFGSSNEDVRVAQNDAACQLVATGLNRDLYVGELPSASNGYAEPTILGTEQFTFYGVKLSNDSSKEVSSVDGSSNGIIIRDGYLPESLRMAIRSDGARAALVNIAGTNTGSQSGAGGFAADFMVNVLSGTSAQELVAKSRGSQINYSKNIQASASELAAPTYSLDASGATVTITTQGKISPSAYGAFRFDILASEDGLPQAGTDYVISNPKKDALEYNQLPAGVFYRSLSDAAKYDLLFSRWQALKGFRGVANQIATSDKSISIPVLTLFPLGTQLFTVYSENNDPNFYDNRNHASVIIRNKANGLVGEDNDSLSGVVSFQAFQIDITSPAGLD